MNARDWYNTYSILQTLEQPGYPSEMGYARELRERLQKEGSRLMQSNNPSLGQALMSGELDAGIVHRKLKKHPLTYMDIDETLLCREICGMDTMFATYVEKFIAQTGWTLSTDRANARWLLGVLEYPARVGKHPGWFEKVIDLHPWAWEVAMPEQFFTMHESHPREFLYDKTKTPWNHPDIVEKMLIWLHHKADQSPHKATLARQAWPEWMEHVRIGMEVHMQVMGPPDSSWSPSSVFTEKYFVAMASSLLGTWQQPLSETLELGTLLDDQPQML